MLDITQKSTALYIMYAIYPLIEQQWAALLRKYNAFSAQPDLGRGRRSGVGGDFHRLEHVLTYTNITGLDRDSVEQEQVTLNERSRTAEGEGAQEAAGQEAEPEVVGEYWQGEFWGKAFKKLRNMTVVPIRSYPCAGM